MSFSDALAELFMLILVSAIGLPARRAECDYVAV